MTDAKKRKLGQTKMMLVTVTQDSGGFQISIWIGLQGLNVVESRDWGLALKTCLHSKHAVFSQMLCLFEVSGEGL